MYRLDVNDWLAADQFYRCVFLYARTACVSCVTCACVLLFFFACVIFLRFLRTFYFTCVLFLAQVCCVRLNGNRALAYRVAYNLQK